MDPRRFNGGPFWASTASPSRATEARTHFGFASAIEVGYDMAESRVVERLASDLDALHGKLANLSRRAAPHDCRATV
jgi:glycerol-3-phosphate acyltransferase PlsX